jgi:ribosome-associated translation inhibitor RaiA
VLTAHESSGDLIHAINEALAKLRRQIIEHKARLRREDEYKRKNRRK